MIISLFYLESDSYKVLKFADPEDAIKFKDSPLATYISVDIPEEEFDVLTEDYKYSLPHLARGVYAWEMTRRRDLVQLECRNEYKAKVAQLKGLL